MTESTVSVLIPCFNAERTIAETIASVESQTWPNIEVIVVDDGSSDRSQDILSRFSALNLRIFSQLNSGAAAARNFALSRASGQWTVFLDSDDVIEPEFVETQVKSAAEANSDVCFGDAAMTWPSGRRLEMIAMPRGATTDIVLSRVLSDGWLPCHAILWKTEFVRSIGGWNPKMRRNDDGELIARALLQAPKIATSSGSRAIYRHHDGPGRISVRSDWRAIASQAAYVEGLSLTLATRGDLPLSRKAVARQAHETANEAYFVGFDDLGLRMEKLARQYGRLQPLGRSRLHTLGVAVLGLRNKQRLSRALSMLKAMKYKER